MTEQKNYYPQESDAVFEEFSTPNYPVEPIRFSGAAKEYFGIWLTNLVLTIATLGIYGPWAKVRRLQYFRNNSILYEFPFGYHATGIQLLKGRMIAFVAIIGYTILVRFNTTVAAVLPVALFLVYPCIINLSLNFTARMTSWRNIHFSWHGTYWKSLWYFQVLPLLGFASFGILLPLAYKHYYRYYALGHSFGTAKFHANPKTSSFYVAFTVATVLPMVVFSAIAIGIIIANAPLNDFLGDETVVSQDKLALIFSVIFILVLLLIATFFLFTTMCRNILLQSLAMERFANFDSKINPLKLLWIWVTNLIVSILSLGLLIPWAKIRQYRYLAQCTFIRAHTDNDEFVDEIHNRMGAIGEEFAGFEGIDIGI